MKIEPIDAAFRKIKRRFDEDSSGWRLLSDHDRYGNKDLFVSQREDLWQIKSKPLSPVTGIARVAHARSLDEEIQSELNARGLEGDKFLFSMVVPQKDHAIMATGVESHARGESSKLKEMLGEKNKNMERDLSKDVEETFAKEHPQRREMYG